MPDYLIIKLQGSLQSWGSHTYEDYRPSYIFPTRSAIVGLLGACLGIERDDFGKREQLNASLTKLTVRADPRYPENSKTSLRMHKISDFHTIQNARKVDGAARKDAVVSRREYLCDAEFSLAMVFTEEAGYSLGDIERAIQKPYYTPFLGRKSCPLQRPLFEAVITANNAQTALTNISPNQGTLYSEEVLENSVPMEIRDIPMNTSVRQFATRMINILGDANVS
jgi:CRISPR system Cascade subunit CasD